jgi:dsRNA-specific ribonuclease
MTDPPLLLPNARHRGGGNGTGGKTGLASLPPKPNTASSSRAGSSSSDRAPIYMGPVPPNRTSTMNTPSPGERNEASAEAESDTTPGFSSSNPVLQLPQNGLASSSTFNSATFSSKVLGKRPLSDIDQAEQSGSSSNPAPTETSTVLTTTEQPRIIPTLPTPLPSKRFKKGSQARASLVPVEQLPVFPLPPLPVITDPALEKQVFTHQSCFPRRKWRFEDPEDDPSLDYEKLEHVGDSILGMVVTTWLHELKPRLTCGRASVS